MINFQIIRKGKNVWEIFLSVLTCSFCAKYFLKIKYFLNYVLKFKCDSNLYVSNKFKTY